MTRGTGSGRCRRLAGVGGSARTQPRYVRLEALIALVDFRTTAVVMEGTAGIMKDDILL